MNFANAATLGRIIALGALELGGRRRSSFLWGTSSQEPLISEDKCMGGANSDPAAMCAFVSRGTNFAPHPKENS